MRRALLLLALLGAAPGAAPLRAAGPDCSGYGRVLFVGDSITRHGPSEKLGWTGDWGMAASAREADYVHRFLARLAAARGGAEPESWILAEGGGKIPDKLPFADRIAVYRPDLAVVQLGENDNRDVTGDGFQKPYERLLAAIRSGSPNGKILCTGVWGQPGGSPAKDAMIRAACGKYGAVFVDLGAVNADPANRAGSLFAHPGVAWHPGDRGMAAYADALWSALSAAPAAPPDAPGAAAAFPPIEEAWSPLGLPWKTAPPVAVEEGAAAARVAAADPAGTVLYAAPLDAAAVRGRSVVVRARVRAEAVSAKPQPWNGVKLMLRIANAEGQLDYPQYRLPDGTYGWTDVAWTVRIPDNAVSVELAIGLEKVSGTAWFAPIRVSAAP